MKLYTMIAPKIEDRHKYILVESNMLPETGREIYL